MKAALALALLGLLACALAQSHDGTFFIEDDPRGGDPRDHREHLDERDHRDHRDADYDVRLTGVVQGAQTELVWLLGRCVAAVTRSATRASGKRARVSELPRTEWETTCASYSSQLR
mgnify:CR=1 FL=1